MELKELQKCILDILIYIDSICTKNNIKYIISSGTCLGAIRHKGFIPWDNDADIIMDRENYNKFYDIMQNEHGRYQIFSYKNKPDYNYPFDKVVDTHTTLVEDFIKPTKGMGVYVDIFPIDFVPNDKKERDLFINKIRKTRLILYYKTSRSKNKIKQIAKSCLFFWVNPKKYCKKLNQLCQKYNKVKTDYLMDVVWGKKYFDANIYDELIKVPFEGHDFYIPKMYDEYLTAIYGDYMTLPPLEQRKVHYIDANWKKDIKGDIYE